MHPLFRCLVSTAYSRKAGVTYQTGMPAGSLPSHNCACKGGNSFLDGNHVSPNCKHLLVKSQPRAATATYVET